MSEPLSSTSSAAPPILPFIDYTMLSSYLTCPRKFFFRHVLHFSSEIDRNINLVFGSAWHKALEFGYTKLAQGAQLAEIIDVSRLGFMHSWNEEGGTAFDDDAVFPKSPGRAFDMLDAYWRQFYPIDNARGVTHIGSEVPFSILLGPNLPNYIGRLDHVLLRDSTPENLEHKTAKTFSEPWLESWRTSLQAAGYTIALKVNFPDTHPIIKINGALCQKPTKTDSKLEFIRRPVMLSDFETDRFLAEIITHASNIVSQLTTFHEEAEVWAYADRSMILPIFIRNPMGCTQYFQTCAYMDLCTACANPAIYLVNSPPHFKIDEWNPHNHIFGGK